MFSYTFYIALLYVVISAEVQSSSASLVALNSLIALRNNSLYAVAVPAIEETLLFIQDPEHIVTHVTQLLALLIKHFYEADPVIGHLFQLANNGRLVNYVSKVQAAASSNLEVQKSADTLTDTLTEKLKECQYATASNSSEFAGCDETISVVESGNSTDDAMNACHSINWGTSRQVNVELSAPCNNKDIDLRTD